jgi:purine-binding chemotaxis protein CheW
MNEENDEEAFERAERLRNRRKELEDPLGEDVLSSEETQEDDTSSQESSADVEHDNEDEKQTNSNSDSKDSDEDDKECQFVIFEVHGQQMTMNIHNTREVVEFDNVTPVFHTPQFLRGVMNLRGEVVAVVDIGAFLGLEPIDAQEGHKILMAQYEGNTAGFLVNDMIGVESIPRGKVSEPPPTMQGVSGQWLAGVITRDGGHLMVLDTASIFQSERIEEL